MVNRYRALQHAVKAHGATPDRCGVLYVLHPMAVADAIERTMPRGADVEDDIVVALLHDVFEDTDYDPDPELFSRRQWDALCAITRRPDERYSSYIARVIDAGELVATVKLADIWHNLLPQRHGCLPEEEQRSLEQRYLKARDMIWSGLGYEWWPTDACQCFVPDIPAPNWFSASWKGEKI